MLAGLAAALAASLLFGLGAVAQAHGVRRLEGRAHRLSSFLVVGVRDPWVMLVVLAYVTGFFLHALSIWWLPLYLAQAAISLSMPITAVASRKLLHEPLGRTRWAGVAAVTVGLVLLAVSAGSPGDLQPSAQLAGSMWAACILLTLFGSAVPRAHGAWLGTLSGLGYSGTAIAVRGIGLPLDAAIVATAIALPLLGTVAFWLYSRALDRAAVTAATAALIVCQTFVPALVGVLLLGDTVRPGWWPGMLGGLGLSTTGAVVLARGALRSPVVPVTGSSPGRAR